MQALKLLSRTAFICNICFIITLLVKMYPDPPGDWFSLFIILGIVVAIPLNVLLAIWIFILVVGGKRSFPGLPKWLMLLNTLFIIPELIFQ